MDPGRNRPSRPRLRSHGNSARVLVFDQTDNDETCGNADGETKKQLPGRIESTEAPVRAGEHI